MAEIISFKDFMDTLHIQGYIVSVHTDTAFEERGLLNALFSGKGRLLKNLVKQVLKAVEERGMKRSGRVSII